MIETKVRTLKWAYAKSIIFELLGKNVEMNKYSIRNKSIPPGKSLKINKCAERLFRSLEYIVSGIVVLVDTS